MAAWGTETGGEWTKKIPWRKDLESIPLFRSMLAATDGDSGEEEAAVFRNVVS